MLSAEVYLERIWEILGGTGAPPVIPAGAATEATLAAAKVDLDALVTRLGEVQANPTANTVLARLKDMLTGVVLAAGSNNIGDVDVLTLPSGTNPLGKVIVPTFVQVDTLIRPANTTAYAANKAVNCDLTVTVGSYVAGTRTVTLTSNGHGLVAGDRITVAGINAGFTWTNVDGNWVVSAADANTFSFVVALTPGGAGANPQTTTVAHAVAKLLSFDIGSVVGGGVILSEISISFQGVAMTGAFRLYIYRQPTTALVDQSNFTLLQANDTYRRDYYDFYPVTEWTGATPSDVTFSTVRLWEVFKCDPADTRLYARLVAEGASTPVASGIITVKMTGIQLLG